MAELSRTLDLTLRGKTLGPAALSSAQPLGTAPQTAAQAPEGAVDENDPEVQRVRAAWDKLVQMMESGQLKVNEDVRKMYDEETARIQAEPVPAAPGPLEAFASTFGALGNAQAFPRLAEGVLGGLEQRRREAVAGNVGKIAALRDLRAQELQYESSEAQKMGDTKTALQKEEELAALQAKMDKEARQREEKRHKEDQAFELKKIGELQKGRESLVRLRQQMKMEDLMSAYNVPKHVAGMMADRRKAIQTSTDALIRSLGGLAMIDETTLNRLQSEEAVKMQASDENVLQQYREGKITPGAVNVPGAAPGAGTEKAPQVDARQKELESIRAAAKR